MMNRKAGHNSRELSQIRQQLRKVVRHYGDLLILSKPDTQHFGEAALTMKTSGPEGLSYRR
jgi:hypothetical protein